MKYIKAIITGVMTMATVFFSGQVQSTMCCVSCAMKKEDEVELKEEGDETQTSGGLA